jgi:hypothetical protein
MTEYMVIREGRMVPNRMTLDKFPVSRIVMLPPTTLAECRNEIRRWADDFESGDMYNVERRFTHTTVIDEWSEFTFHTSYRIERVREMKMEVV